jgi:hypothetical protein
VSQCGELVLFEAGKGTHDWNYPFDLCGTLYRGRTIRAILSHLESSRAAALRHPNALEAAGQDAFRAAHAAPPPPGAGPWLRAAMARRVMVVVTINRVQVPPPPPLPPPPSLPPVGYARNRPALCGDSRPQPRSQPFRYPAAAVSAPPPKRAACRASAAAAAARQNVGSICRTLSAAAAAAAAAAARRSARLMRLIDLLGVFGPAPSTTRC